MSPQPRSIAPGPIAYIALGSNLGDPAANILRAFERLKSLSTHPLHTSSLWETPPVNCPPGAPSFINAAAALVPLPGETPGSLLRQLQAIEQEFGRKPKQVVNESRPLDLDLIAFGSIPSSSPKLILPHPRAHLRRFVLEPLSEIAPSLVLPGQTCTVRDLLLALPPDPNIRKI